METKSNLDIILPESDSFKNIINKIPKTLKDHSYGEIDKIIAIYVIKTNKNSILDTEVYHGTSWKNANGIAGDGFHLSQGKVFFSLTPNMALNWSLMKSTEDNNNCAIIISYVEKINIQIDNLHKKDDSRFVNKSEYILPKYIIHIKSKNDYN